MRLLSIKFLVLIAAFLAPAAPDPGGPATSTAFDQTAASDLDWDGVADGVDNCQLWRNPDQTDVNNNGLGDLCECADQDGNRDVAVSDLVAINRAIFSPGFATPLCNASYDSRCDVQDIVGTINVPGRSELDRGSL